MWASNLVRTCFISHPRYPAPSPFSYLKKQHACAVLEVRHFVDDTAVALGVQFGLLLAVRQQRHHVLHEVPVAESHAARGQNQNLLEGTGERQEGGR